VWNEKIKVLGIKKEKKVNSKLSQTYFKRMPPLLSILFLSAYSDA